MGSLPERYNYLLFFYCGSLKFHDNTSQFRGMLRMGDWAFRMSRLQSPYLTSKAAEDPPHSRRYVLGACGLHNCINMQLLCNYVELQAISPALAIVFENMTPTNKAFVSVRLYFDCTQSAVKVLFQQHWLL